MKKTSIAVLCIVLALTAAVGSAAIRLGTAKSQSGTVVSQIANRVNFTFENTEQIFTYSDEGYVAEILFTAQKTEADFYAVMHTISLDGIDYDRTEIIPAENSEYPASFDEAILPVKNGEPVPMQWQIRIFFHADPGEELHPTLHVDYTSGTNKQTAIRRIFDAALTFKIENA